MITPTRVRSKMADTAPRTAVPVAEQFMHLLAAILVSILLLVASVLAVALPTLLVVALKVVLIVAVVVVVLVVEGSVAEVAVQSQMVGVVDDTFLQSLGVVIGTSVQSHDVSGQLVGVSV